MRYVLVELVLERRSPQYDVTVTYSTRVARLAIIPFTASCSKVLRWQLSKWYGRHTVQVEGATDSFTDGAETVKLLRAVTITKAHYEIMQAHVDELGK